MNTPLKLTLISSVLLISGCDLARSFYVGDNGVTVHCEDLDVGEIFHHNGYSYLVVDNDSIQDYENQEKLTII